MLYKFNYCEKSISDNAQILYLAKLISADYKTTKTCKKLQDAIQDIKIYNSKYDKEAGTALSTQRNV